MARTLVFPHFEPRAGASDRLLHGLRGGRQHRLDEQQFLQSRRMDQRRDRRMSRPATVVAALLTLGLVPPDQDESQGAVWRAVRDGAWGDAPEPGRAVLRVRRIGLKARGRRRDGSLMIGVALEGRCWRVACDGIAPPAGLGWAMPAGRQPGAPPGEPRPGRAPWFRARAVAASRWAALGASDGGLPSAPGCALRALSAAAIP
ncbi:hypothetical protein J4558_18020 [Leptolyngbya sp. 15MV]|nr:hypothetical protein J4558_18020 [Leptolyngbya sp. 15MV]